MIYLDNAATTKIDKNVLDAMMPYLTDYYGNPGTLYEFGQESAKAVWKAREQVADLINAEPENIIFTSGGTEANNLVIRGFQDYLPDHINNLVFVTSSIEHDSIMNINWISPRVKIRRVNPGSDGKINPEDIRAVLRNENVALVSVMHTNNETGIVNDIKAIGEICNKADVYFHTDCVQAASYSKLDVEEFQCDFLSLSSHKIHGPKGVGALYVRDRDKLMPIIRGGKDQEFGLRAGTENVAGIVGFGKACEILSKGLDGDRKSIDHSIRVFQERLESNLAKDGLSDIMHINGSGGKVLNLRFDDVDGETLLLMLDAAGVCVSAGSACRSHESEPSYVLRAMGIDDEDARNSIRVSVSSMSYEEEMFEAADRVAKCVKEIYNQGGVML